MGKIGSSPVKPPEPLNAGHQVVDFSCGTATLDDWLKRQALRNEQSGASRTYVITVGPKVIGYYALAAASILRAMAPGPVRRNMPDLIPVILLGRLAVDVSWKGQGLGRGLLRDAILRTIHASTLTGVRAMLVHAFSDTAKEFYAKAGFLESPMDPKTLFLLLHHARTSLQDL